MSLVIMRRLCGTTLLLLLLLPVPASAQHFPPAEDLELMLRYLVEDGATPGIAFGVRDRDGSTTLVAYGSGGADAGPLGPRSRFEIGALTMTFTATLLADMVARGEVALDDPVARYLPDGVTLPSPAGYVMTVGDLATHRSGLPADRDIDVDHDLPVEDFYALISEAELERPGRRYAFSHLGYGLLGHALARAAGMPYADLLRERVLEPLGMERTDYGQEGEPAERMARGHAGDDAVDYTFATAAMRGATGLRSSAEDMLRYLEANVGPPETELERAMRMAHEIRVDRGNPESGTGYGFSWRTYSVARQPPIIVHAGGTPGFSSLIAFDPEQEIGTVLLANTRAFDDWLGRNILFFDPPSSRAEAPGDPSVLGRYAGTYKVDRGTYTAAHDRGQYFIRLEDEGYLTYQARDLVRTRLYARSDSSFYMLRGPYTVTFGRQGDGVRMIIHVDDREPQAPALSWTSWRVDEETPPPAVVAGYAASWRAWGAGTWALVALLGLGTLAVITRPLWSRRSGRPGG